MKAAKMYISMDIYHKWIKTDKILEKKRENLENRKNFFKFYVLFKLLKLVNFKEIYKFKKLGDWKSWVKMVLILRRL